ncbi:MAG: AAA family ATPase [Bacteroidetes bacterium]|nr:AAA family ATPase [Bacteroidota bacterium]
MRYTLSSISTTGGFLENCKIQFSPKLTCIIGARGTCKSTVIESIRFALRHGSDEKLRTIESGIIQNTLGFGTVNCELLRQDDTDESRFVIEREVGSEATIFEDDIRELETNDFSNCVEIYSQGQIQELADQADEGLRLALIDRPKAAHILMLQLRRNNLAGQLRKVGNDLRSVNSEIAIQKEQLQPSANVQRQLEELNQNSPSISNELEVENISFERRNRVLAELNELAMLQSETLEDVRVLRDRLEHALRLYSGFQSDADFSSDLTTKQPFDDFVDGIPAVISTLGILKKDNLKTIVPRVSERFTSLNANYFRLRQEQQRANEFLKRKEMLNKQQVLLASVQKKLDEAEKRRDTLNLERQKLRAEIESLDGKIFDTRFEEVEKINEEHAQRIQLTLRYGTGSPKYVTALTDMLSGSRIKFRDEVARQIASTLTPFQLVDYVEQADSIGMAELLGRDIGQMQRVIAHLSDHESLFELEVTPPLCQLEIVMFDDGVAKPIETLSKGQKATAILPLILRPLPYPLIFDQPEDDLDNRHITERLIDAITQLKESRQIIFVTHNANIPVLGEAESIVVMSMDTPHRANPPKVGSVDERKFDILDLLEGGIDAFQKREAKYKQLLEA